jgi:hypothetical protein
MPGYWNICTQILWVFSEQGYEKVKSGSINLKFFEHHGAYYPTHAFYGKS